MKRIHRPAALPLLLAIPRQSVRRRRPRHDRHRTKYRDLQIRGDLSYSFRAGGPWGSFQVASAPAPGVACWGHFLIPN